MKLRQILALSISLASPALAEHYKLFVLTGQSNSLGTTNGDEVDPSIGDSAADARVQFYWHNVANASTSIGDSSGAFTTLQEQQGGYYGGSASHWGPEINFARTLMRGGVRNFGVIKASRGGGGNSLWSKSQGGHMYNHVVNTVTAATTKLTNDGHTFEIIGLLYLQGESDSTAEASIAGTRLKEFTDNLRADLPNATALHCVSAGIAAPGSNRDTVRSQHAAIASTTSYIDYFSNLDQQANTASDALHFNKVGKLRIGERFALRFFDAHIVDRHYGKFVFYGDSITQGGRSNPSYRYQVFKNLANAGVQQNPTNGYQFVGSVNGAWKNEAGSTPDVNGQSFVNQHDGHWGWRAFWINGRVALPTGRVSDNRGTGDLKCWTGQATTFNFGGTETSYTGTTYIPDTASILIGINDSSESSSEQVRDDIGVLIDQLQAANPNVTIFLNQILATDGRVADSWVNATNGLLPALAIAKSNASSSVFINQTNADFNPAAQTYDDVHPNTSGEEYVGNQISVGLGLIETQEVPEESTLPTIEKDNLSIVFLGNQIWDTSLLNGWSEYNGGGTSESLTSTALNFDHSSSSAASSLNGTSSSLDGGTTLWSSSNDGDWTFETTLTTHECSSGFALWLGTGTNRIIVQIYDNRILDGSGSSILTNINNEDGQAHTYRIAHISAAGRYHLWRDGELLSPESGYSYTSSVSDERLILGDSTSGAFGDNFNVTIESVSYDQSGAYLPKAAISGPTDDKHSLAVEFTGNQIWSTSFVNSWSDGDSDQTAESLNGSNFVFDHSGFGAGVTLNGTNATLDAGATTWLSGNNSDWTSEITLKLEECSNGFVLWYGTGDNRIAITIFADRTQGLGDTGFNVAHNNEDGAFHTYRVTHDSVGSKYHVWRDNVRLTPLAGAEYTSTNADSRLLFGDYTGGIHGDDFKVEIASISYDLSGAYLPLEADYDQDGLSDAYEYEHFGDFLLGDPDLDSDGDGHSNYDEFLSGFDPNNNRSLLKIKGIKEVSEDTWDITVPDTTSERVYSLYKSTDLGLLDEWAVVPGQQNIRGTNGLLTFNLTTSDDGCFYRVEAKLP